MGKSTTSRNRTHLGKSVNGVVTCIGDIRQGKTKKSCEDGRKARFKPEKKDAGRRVSGGFSSSGVQPHGRLGVIDFAAVGQVCADDQQDQPHAVGYAMFEVQPLQLGVDRVHGDGEFAGDGRIRCVLKDKPDDLKRRARVVPGDRRSSATVPR